MVLGTAQSILVLGVKGEMKRFRVLRFDFDSRATILDQEILPTWEPAIRAQWEESRAQVVQHVRDEFGVIDADDKLQNFRDLGPRPFSVLAFHNKFLAQSRNAFIVGAYYPALTGACALGERILNHLTLKLRDDFRHSDLYKKVHSKQSFDNWSLPITALSEWRVLLPEVASAFGELEKLRNRAIHFKPETDQNDRPMALEALQLLTRIVSEQFPMMGLQPWFIPGARGESFIQSKWETDPFVREVYIPNCLSVGPLHTIEQVRPEFLIRDVEDYPDVVISDEEYLRVRNAFLDAPRADA